MLLGRQNENPRDFSQPNITRSLRVEPLSPGGDIMVPDGFFHLRSSLSGLDSSASTATRGVRESLNMKSR